MARTISNPQVSPRRATRRAMPQVSYSDDSAPNSDAESESEEPDGEPAAETRVYPTRSRASRDVTSEVTPATATATATATQSSVEADPLSPKRALHSTRSSKAAGHEQSEAPMSEAGPLAHSTRSSAKTRAASRGVAGDAQPEEREPASSPAVPLAQQRRSMRSAAGASRGVATHSRPAEEPEKELEPVLEEQEKEGEDGSESEYEAERQPQPEPLPQKEAAPVPAEKETDPEYIDELDPTPSDDASESESDSQASSSEHEFTSTPPSQSQEDSSSPPPGPTQRLSQQRIPRWLNGISPFPWTQVRFFVPLWIPAPIREHLLQRIKKRGGHVERKSADAHIVFGYHGMSPSQAHAVTNLECVASGRAFVAFPEWLAEVFFTGTAVAPPQRPDEPVFVHKNGQTRLVAVADQDGDDMKRLRLQVLLERHGAVVVSLAHCDTCIVPAGDAALDKSRGPEWAEWDHVEFHDPSWVDRYVSIARAQQNYEAPFAAERRWQSHSQALSQKEPRPRATKQIQAMNRRTQVEVVVPTRPPAGKQTQASKQALARYSSPEAEMDIDMPPPADEYSSSSSSHSPSPRPLRRGPTWRTTSDTPMPQSNRGPNRDQGRIPRPPSPVVIIPPRPRAPIRIQGRVEFTADDRDRLARYLAWMRPDDNGRTTRGLYDYLGSLANENREAYAWVRRHTVSSWHEHFRKNRNRRLPVDGMVLGELVDYYVDAGVNSGRLTTRAESRARQQQQQQQSLRAGGSKRRRLQDEPVIELPEPPKRRRTGRDSVREVDDEDDEQLPPPMTTRKRASEAAAATAKRKTAAAAADVAEEDEKEDEDDRSEVGAGEDELERDEEERENEDDDDERDEESNADPEDAMEMVMSGAEADDEDIDLAGIMGIVADDDLPGGSNDPIEPFIMDEEEGQSTLQRELDKSDALEVDGELEASLAAPDLSSVAEEEEEDSEEEDDESDNEES